MNLYYQPIARWAGINLGVAITALAYSVYIFRKKDELSLSFRIFLLFQFFLVSVETNYYNYIVFGLILLALHPALVILITNNVIKRLLFEFGLLFVIAGIVYYFFPHYILISHSQETIFMLDIPLLTIIVSLYLTPLIAMNWKLKNRQRIKLLLKVYVPLLILIAILAIFDYTSHIWYGLYFMYVAIILNKKRLLNTKDSDYVFLCGTIITIDDIIGYNLYPTGFGVIIDTIICPVMLIITMLYYVRKTHRK